MKVGLITKPGLSPSTLGFARFSYQLASIIVYIICVAIAWFVFGQVLGVAQTASRQIMINLNGVDNMYINVDQFLSYLFMGLLVPGIFMLAIWVWQYTQRQTYIGGY